MKRRKVQTEGRRKGRERCKQRGGRKEERGKQRGGRKEQAQELRKEERKG